MSITIPNSVTFIDEEAFYSCKNLANITYTGSSAKWQDINIASGGNDCLIDATVHYDN